MMALTNDLLNHLFKPAVYSKTSMNVRVIPQKEIDPLAIARWRDLAKRSCHHNPFLLPEFVLPAWKHLTPDREHVLIVVESLRDGRWLAAGGFSLAEVTRGLPVPHAVASTSLYTFRTGLLLDADHAGKALDLLLSRITSGGWLYQGVEFPGLRYDSILARELTASVRRLGYSWRALEQKMVPAVFPEIVSDEYLTEHWSKSRRKTFRRSRNKLAEVGPVELKLHREPESIAAALDTFLRLESDSWKGEEGTACLSNPRDEAFVREVIEGLAPHGNVVVSELTAGDRVAASAINFTAGTALFAFKIGWDSEFSHTSPGVLHEVELLHASQDRLRDFTLFDSCATESSYIAPIWPERIPIVTGLICASSLARWSRRLIDAGGRAKHLVVSWW